MGIYIPIDGISTAHPTYFCAMEPRWVQESEVWEQLLTYWEQKWDSTFGGHIAIQQNFLNAFAKLSFQKFYVLFYLYLLQNLLLSSLEGTVN